MTIPELANLLAERHHDRIRTDPWADLSDGQRAAKAYAMGRILADLRAIAGGCGDE